MTIRVLVLCCRDPCCYDPTLLIVSWLQNWWQLTLAGEASCRVVQGRDCYRCPQGSPAWLHSRVCSSWWVTGLREQVPSWQGMTGCQFCLCQKRENCILEKVKLHFQILTCKAIKIVQETAQASKCTSLCMICREVLWLICSLILWKVGKSLIKNHSSFAVSSPACNCCFSDQQPHWPDPLHCYVISIQFVNMCIPCPASRGNILV